MPKYRVTDAKSGKTLELTGDSPPTEQELEEIFSSYSSPQPVQKVAAPKAAEPKPLINPAHQVMADLAHGAAKGAAKSVVGLGRAVHSIPGVSSAVDGLYNLFGTKVDSAKDFGQTGQQAAESRLGLASSNTAQSIGMAAEQAGEYLIPSGAALKAVKAAPLLGRAPALVQRMIAEGGSAVPVALAQGMSGEGAAATGAVSGAMPLVARAATRLAKGATKFAFKPTEEALEKNPAIIQDILDGNIGLNQRGANTAKAATNQARQVADDLVRTHSTPANRVNLQQEIIDPTFYSPTSVRGTGQPNTIGNYLRGATTGPGHRLVDEMVDDITTHKPRTLSLEQVHAMKREQGARAAKVFGDTPDTSLRKNFDADLHDAADVALGNRIGPQWGQANDKTMRHLTTQRVVEDALGKSQAESHMPNPYDTFLLTRGAATGNPVDIGIALAREAGRVRPLVAAAGRTANRHQNTLPRGWQALRGALSGQPEEAKRKITKQEADARWAEITGGQ
jgi:hypothetical protein